MSDDVLKRIQEAAEQSNIEFAAQDHVEDMPDWAMEKVERALMKSIDVDDRMMFVSDQSVVGDVTDDPDKLALIGEILGRTVTDSDTLVELAQWMWKNENSVV